MNILIIGGGIAARRYIESLLWTEHNIYISGKNVLGNSKKISEEYILPYFDFDNVNVSLFDVIIVCNAINGKYNIVYDLIEIKGYRKALIIEKPLTIFKEEITCYKELLNKLKACAVVCQRDFCIEKYQIPDSSSYNIIWHSIKSEYESNIIHMLPHLLSWLMIEIGDDIVLTSENNILKGKINKRDVVISFESSEINGIEINGKFYESPNYRNLNKDIVNKVYSFNKHDSDENIDRAIKASKIICKLLEEKNGKY